DFLPVEQRPDRRDGLVQPVQALPDAGPELNAVGLVLQLHPCPTDAEDRPPTARVIDRRDRLRDDARVAERVRADQQAEPRPLRLAGTGAEQRVALKEALIRVAEDRVEVIPGPEMLVAEPVDLPGRREHL